MQFSSDAVLSTKHNIIISKLIFWKASFIFYLPTSKGDSFFEQIVTTYERYIDCDGATENELFP